MAVYGYCRISRAQQNIERQIRNIKAVYPEAVIIQEAFTGTKIDRPEWNKLFKRTGEGDVIIFDSVSRMSRNAEEGFAAYEDLFDFPFPGIDNKKASFQKFPLQPWGADGEGSTV